MIKSFAISDDDKQIAIYAGMVTSAFALAEFSTSVLWGKLSDHVGRKPILLTGLAGTGLSMLVFGFAPNLPVALLARALGGFLNGNIGVLQTTVAEVVPIKEQQPRAFAIMPFVWCFGSIIGSGLGGFFADPVKNFPTLFAQGTIFQRYPYLLPNLVSTLVVLVGLVVGILFLEETHEQKKHRRDIGLEMGQWLLRKLDACPNGSQYSKLEDANLDETTTLIDDCETPPSYLSTKDYHDLKSAQAECCAVDELSVLELDPEASETKEKPAAQRALTAQVMGNVVSYGILA
ncbi:MAG: hypothetical protein Q9159_000637 [Coniocarpon cinnabarinum]